MIKNLFSISKTVGVVPSLPKLTKTVYVNSPLCSVMRPISCREMVVCFRAGKAFEHLVLRK